MQWKPNVTVAAIIRNKKRYLLVEENAENRVVFNQPAGHLENNETLIDAVKREVLEETAWHFHPQGLSGIYLHKNQHSRITYLRFCFYGNCDDFEEHRSLDEDIIRTAWMSLDDIKLNQERMRTPLVLQCIEDYLSGNDYPLEILKSNFKI